MSKKDVCDEYLRTDIDITQPRYDQNTYMGRLKHFYYVTHPFNAFTMSSTLEKCKETVDKYKNKEKLCITEDELWHAKHLLDSAYHPDTGEKVPCLSRMCSQVYGNMFIVGGMLTFYKSKPAVVFWQWLNQTYNTSTEVVMKP